MDIALCAATTASGHRCARCASAGDDLCGSHRLKAERDRLEAEKIAEFERIAAQRYEEYQRQLRVELAATREYGQCAAATKVGTRCQLRTIPGGEVCELHRQGLQREIDDALAAARRAEWSEAYQRRLGAELADRAAAAEVRRQASLEARERARCTVIRETGERCKRLDYSAPMCWWHRRDSERRAAQFAQRKASAHLLDPLLAGLPVFDQVILLSCWLTMSPVAFRRTLAELGAPRSIFDLALPVG